MSHSQHDDDEIVDTTIKRQKLASAQSATSISTLSPVLLGQIHRQHPIHLFEWKADQPLIPLAHSMTKLIIPPSPFESTSSTTTTSKPDPSSTIPTHLPIITPEQILATQKECLPLDSLPAAFLRDVSSNDKGKIILAVQFIPNETLNPPHPTATTLALTDPAEPLHQQATSEHLSETTTSTDDVSNTSTPPFTTFVLGCVLSLFMQYWSRFEGTEFKLQRIVNIMSIFVSPSIRRCGVARALLDANFYEFSQHAPRIDEIALEVRATNVGAQKAYKSCGFTVQRQEKGYYEFGSSPKDKTCYEMVVKYDEYRTSSAQSGDGE